MCDARPKISYRIDSRIPSVLPERDRRPRPGSRQDTGRVPSRVRPLKRSWKKSRQPQKQARKVAMISLNKFVTVLRIAGAVQKQPSFAAVSGVSFPVRKVVQPDKRGAHDGPKQLCREVGSKLGKIPSRTAKPIVTAGFRCASLLPHAMAVKTPAITAKAHPVVIAIQPLPSAFERLSSTAATTPSPSRTKNHRPRNSPSTGEVISECLRQDSIQSKRSCNRFLPLFIQLLAFHLGEMRLPVRSTAQLARNSSKPEKNPTARPAA